MRVQTTGRCFLIRQEGKTLRRAARRKTVMKKSLAGLVSVAAAAGMLLFSAAVFAAVSTGAARDLNKLNVNVMMLNQDAALPLAQKIIKKQIVDTYSLMNSKVDYLLSRNMTYGDAAATLAFASHMPGGTTDENINRVVDLQKAGNGWDRIATSLGVPTSIVADSLSALENNVHMGVKEALVASPPYGEAAGGAGTPGMQPVPGQAGTGTSGQPYSSESPGSGYTGGAGY
jgi:hypothetical protein